MIIDWGKVRIFVKPGATDLRKQINGLSVIVSDELKMNVFEGNLFLFCNKHRYASARLHRKNFSSRFFMAPYRTKSCWTSM